MIWVALTIAGATAAGIGTERRFGVRAGDGARRLLKVMLYVLVPPVVFFNIARLELSAGVGAGIALGWVALALAGLIAWATGRHLLRLQRPSTGSLINVALQGNTAYLGYPLCAAFLGTDSLSEAVAYDALVQGPLLFLGVFGVGAAFGTRAGETARERLKAFLTRNPPLIAVALGLLAPGALAPDALVDASRVLVFALLPLGFFAVGVALAEEAEQDRHPFPPPFTRPVAAACALRLLAAPLLLFALATPFVDVPDAYLLLAATPAGVNGLVVAHAYGLDLPFTAAAIAWTTALMVVGALGLAVL